MTLKVGTFNLLADGLCENEFFSVNTIVRGNNTSLLEDCNRFIRWHVREEKIVQVLYEMFEFEDCSVIVTQENDHFYRIFNLLQEKLSFPLSGVYARNYDQKAAKHSTGHRVWTERLASQRKDNISFSRTFQEECGGLTALACQFYGAVPEDIYVSDDGVGVYYRADRVTLRAVTAPLLKDSASTAPIILQSPVIHSLDAPHCVKCSFDWQGRSLEIYGTHLTSGEQIEKEIERFDQLHQILQCSLVDSCPVIVMDSNNSVHYEESYPSPGSLISIPSKNDPHLKEDKLYQGCLSDLVKRYQMVDMLSFQRRNECLKMRNRLTNQVSKAFHFMFDTIDKILVRNDGSIRDNIVDLDYQDRLSFHRYDWKDYDYFLSLRKNQEQRQAFHDYCLRHVFTTCTYQAFFAGQPQEESQNREYYPLLQLYPNERACSDHPPIIANLFIHS